MLPAIATACVAILGLLIWRGRLVSRQVSTFGAALTGSSLLLAALLLPAHSLGTPVCDAFGGPFLLLIAGGGGSLMIVAGVAAWQPELGARVAAAAVTGLILLAAFFKLFPGCLASPYAMVDPLVASLWLDQVAETMSFHTMLQLEPQKIPGFYGFPVLTLFLAATAMLRSTAFSISPDRSRRDSCGPDRNQHLADAWLSGGRPSWRRRFLPSASRPCGPVTSKDESSCSQRLSPLLRALQRAVWSRGP
jgi:hypothetical protein